MLNNDAVSISKANLPSQSQYVLNAYPQIGQIIYNDNINCLKADYFAGIDAYGITADGHRSYRLQFKSRIAGNNDFELLAYKLSGRAAFKSDIGFLYEGTKYSFKCNETDIWVENINGVNYSITRDELTALEKKASEFGLPKAISAIRPCQVYSDDGKKFCTGDYYIFIQPEKLYNLRSKIYSQHLKF